jgi:hypothetical protein
MVIDDLYVFRVVVLPAKADAILIVDANAVVAFAVFDERFEMVSGRHFKVIERNGRVQDRQFLPGGAAKIGRDAAALASFPKELCVRVAKALDHLRIIMEMR